MAIDPEFQKKLQVFLAVAIVLAGGRAAYIVYERHEAVKEDAKPKQETALKADYYVTPKKLHAYDLKSARQLTEQPVWVKVGYSLTYYPYDVARHKTDFGHEGGNAAPAAEARDFGRRDGCCPTSSGDQAGARPLCPGGQ